METFKTKEPPFWSKQWISNYCSPLPLRIDKITLTVPPDFMSERVFGHVKGMKSVNMLRLKSNFGHIYIQEEAIDPNRSPLWSIWEAIILLQMKGGFQVPLKKIPQFMIDQFKNPLSGKCEVLSYSLLLIIMKNIRVTGLELALDTPTSYIDMDLLLNSPKLSIERYPDGSWSAYSRRYKGERRSPFIVYPRTVNLQKKDPDRLAVYDNDQDYIRLELRLNHNQLSRMLGHQAFILDFIKYNGKWVYCYSNWLKQPYQYLMYSLLFQFRKKINEYVVPDGMDISEIFHGYPDKSIYDWIINKFEMEYWRFKQRMQKEYF